MLNSGTRSNHLSHQPGFVRPPAVMISKTLFFVDPLTVVRGELIDSHRYRTEKLLQSNGRCARSRCRQRALRTSERVSCCIMTQYRARERRPRKQYVVSLLAVPIVRDNVCGQSAARTAVCHQDLWRCWPKPNRMKSADIIPLPKTVFDVWLSTTDFSTHIILYNARHVLFVTSQCANVREANFNTILVCQLLYHYMFITLRTNHFKILSFKVVIMTG